ncbi:unnamed protein product [Chrysoparadoxa australica]
MKLPFLFASCWILSAVQAFMGSAVTRATLPPLQASGFTAFKQALAKRGAGQYDAGLTLSFIFSNEALTIRRSWPCPFFHIFKEALTTLSFEIPAEIQAKLANYEKKNKVMVYSWISCPFCKKAKALIGSLIPPSEYEVIELDQREDGKAMRYELSLRTGRTSMPQIFIGGEFVGGCGDGPGVVPLNEQGKLVPMLKKAGCKTL